MSSCESVRAGAADVQPQPGAGQPESERFDWESDLLVEEADEGQGQRFREVRGPAARLVRGFAVLMFLVHVQLLYFTPVEPWLLRALHLAFAMTLIFLLAPALKHRRGVGMGLTDMVLAGLGVASAVYIFVSFSDLSYRAGTSPTSLDLLFALLTLLLVLEMIRRTSGIALVLLGLAAILYALIGPMLPGALWHRGYSIQRIISYLYSPMGIYGSCLAASAQYVLLFVVFGAFLQKAGASQMFVRVAVSLTGRTRGGPAKVPVLSSALFGTVSGSAVSNVLVDGYMTIPAMKKIGLTPAIAGAIEAVASTGGQLMPPVMGTAAFLMAELTGISYGDIAKAALIPALLYYFALYWMIDFQVAKIGSRGLPGHLLPSLRRTLASGGYLLLPLLLLVVSVMVLNVSAIRGAVWAIVATIVLSWFNRRTAIGPDRFTDAIFSGAKNVMEVAATTAGAGIIVGIFALTGIGVKIAGVVVTLAGGHLILVLILTMLVTLQLGMGLPTLAEYAIVSAVLVPALTQLGVPLLSAHLFIFYFAILASVTPPVALAVYAASAIAKASIWRTGYEAILTAAAGFIVPYMFVYNSVLLMQGDPVEIAVAVFTAAIGVIALASSVRGWLLRSSNPIERLIVLVAALLLITPGLLTDVPGMAMFAGVLLWQHVRQPVQRPA